MELKKDIAFTEMFALQNELQAAHPEWGGHDPKFGQNFLLYAFEELGEVVSIFKKKGEDAILRDPEVRGCFLEECSDVLMYLCDMMQSMGVQPEELGEAYRKKIAYNLHRDWLKQNGALYTHSILNENGEEQDG